MARKWWTLIVVCIGAFMLLLDITVVTVALPDIERDLDASLGDLQWVLDAYALGLAALTLISGSLGDRIGRRFVFTAGMGIFTVASLLCALSWDPLVLNLARGLQGVGGAAMFGTTIALIAQEFVGRERSTALAIWGAVVGVAVAAGPLVGGLLVDTLGWPWIFYINLPIGVVAIALALLRLRETRDPQTGGLDWGGLVTLGTGLFLVVYAILRGNAEGWSSGEVIGSFVAGAVLLTAFTFIEFRQADPMFNVRLFRVPTFTGASITAFALSSSIFAMLAYFVLYLQNVLGHSAIEAGAALLPLTALTLVFSALAGVLIKRVPLRAILAAGLALIGFGFVAIYASVDAASDWKSLMLGFALMGVGIGLINPALAEVAVIILPSSRAGMLTGINNTFRQVGVAAGIAVLGAILEYRVAGTMQSVLAEGPPAVEEHAAELGEAAASGRVEAAFAAVPPESRTLVLDASRAAFVSALDEIVVVSAVIAFVGAICAFTLIRSSDYDPAAMTEVPVEKTPTPSPA